MLMSFVLCNYVFFSNSMWFFFFKRHAPDLKEQTHHTKITQKLLNQFLNYSAYKRMPLQSKKLNNTCQYNNMKALPCPYDAVQIY